MINRSQNAHSRLSSVPNLRELLVHHHVGVPDLLRVSKVSSDIVAAVFEGKTIPYHFAFHLLCALNVLANTAYELDVIDLPRTPMTVAIVGHWMGEAWTMGESVWRDVQAGDRDHTSVIKRS
jgi:hypothetical protein